MWEIVDDGDGTYTARVYSTYFTGSLEECERWVRASDGM